ncbi:hypothetical protein J5T34_20510 [Cupriavidus gilardii]|uniref:hypothetical protein n=1 Tax=Cupriavidus gilardii TaxID=82541 RepID=UPI001ABE463F|nr:hypothetical protein [Cupriavidus gilardii]MBO4123115.1 hypothetical protein [Cupriavidus gilardii]
MANFHAWEVTALRHGANGDVVAGRLQAGATLTLEEIVDSGVPRSIAAPAPYELFGPGDVQRLAPGAITRRYPPPGASDAEDTKRALVEFSAADTLDLPWRYSPDPTLPGAIRPWLVLVVGLPGDVVPGRDGRVTLSAKAQADHRLNDSHQWAHVHEIDDDRYSRILSPKKLEPQTAYVACLVPAYVVEPDGTLRDAWPVAAGQPVRLTCYDSWGFRTGEGGDFGEIAKRLRTPVDGELKADFGRAKLHCLRRGQAVAGEPATVALPMGGALQRVSMVGAPADPVAPWLATETAALTAMPPMPRGRWLLTAPRYHAPFTMPGTSPAAGWRAQFHTDPRHRGAAGLGAWAAIAWQDRIAKAAAMRAGDLAIARERIGNVALGVEVSRSLWFRHMPPDPVDKLAVLGAMLGRMPVNAQQTVSSALTGRTPGMVPAIWSSAARRALRPGPARSALTRDGVIPHRALLEAAAACPVDPDDPDAIWERPRGDAGPLLKDAVRRAFDDERQADDMLQMLMDSGTTTDLNRLAAAFDALTPDEDGRVDPDKVIRAVREPPEWIDEPAIGQWIDRLGTSRPRCRPVDLNTLGQRVADAVNPFAARPPVVDRVLATLTGIDDIGPVEIEPELDLPLWQFLNEAAPDWMLPGIGDLQQDRVVGLATHAAFVEGVLAGANHQALGELRWRNVPIAPRWSPLRKFWQRTGGQFDIHLIRNWPADTALGGAALTPLTRASEAVVLFKTPLFRRYPDTVVYLYEARDGWPVPDPDEPLEASRKHFPTFPGRIGPDVAFFAFDVAPADLGKYWVVLEEPPAGYRFYSRIGQQELPSGPVADGAAYGLATFAPPVRVMIGKLELA